MEGWGGAWVAEYLEVKQSREQDLPSMGCVVQQVLSLDDVDDLGQQQVLGRVPQPRVEDPVRLEGDTGVSERFQTYPQTHFSQFKRREINSVSRC